MTDQARKEVLVGGQAVLEGVMMRVKNSILVAVRTPTGEIVQRDLSIDPKKADRAWRKKPIIRGILALGQAMLLGIKALTFSADCALEEDEQQGELGNWAMAMTLLTSLLMSLGLFVFLPLFFTGLVKELFAFEGALLFNSIDGLFRAVILVTYIWAISLMPDIKRVFAYHGAEHKTVFAHEAGVELSVENVRKFPKEHPRCGTSFLLLVVIQSVIIFTLLGREMGLLERGLWRVLIMPLIAGLSYETLRISAKHQGHVLVQALIAPGLWLQQLTTKEPDDSQLEVAIVALSGALAVEAEHQKTLTEADSPPSP